MNAFVTLQRGGQSKQELVLEGNEQWRELKNDKDKVESMIDKAKKVKTRNAPKKKKTKKQEPSCPDGVYKNPTTLYQKFVNTYVLTEGKDKSKHDACLEANDRWKEIKDNKALVEQLVDNS